MRGISPISSIDKTAVRNQNRTVAIRKHESEPSPREITVAGLTAARDIDERSTQEAEALLSAVLCAAWPTLHAQNQ